MKNYKFSAFLVTVTIICAVLPLLVWGTITTAETPIYGGTLTRINSFTTGNVIGVPWKMSGPNPQIFLPTADPLVSQDGSGKVLPYLAKDWKIADDRLSITFHLRQDVKFHDGTDFNAQAAKWNMENQIQNNSVGTGNWASVDVLDDYTIRLNLKKWDNSVLNSMASLYMNMGFISPTAYKKNGEEWCNTHPVSTGPFKLESFDQATGAVYVKNENYWQKGKPYIDKLVFTVIQDPMAGALAFRKGDAQILGISRAEYMETKAQLIAEGYEMTPYEHGMGLYNLFPSSADPDSPLANIKIREAIEYAIDKEGICQAIGHGLWTPVYQEATNTCMAYNEDIKARKYDVNQAKKLIAESGYTADELTFDCYCFAGDMNLVQAVQANLRAAGISIKVQVVDRATSAKMIFDGWNGLILGGMGGQAFWTSAMTRYFSTPASQYASMLRTPGFVKAFAAAQEAVEYDAIKAAIQKAVKIAQEEAMVIPLFEHEPDFMVNTEVVQNPGIRVSGLWDLPNLWLKQ